MASNQEANTPGFFDGSPVVFWDGYGLDNPASGVFTYAKNLASELSPLGVHPVVVGQGATHLDGTRFLPLPAPALGARFGSLKPIFPQRVGRVVHQTTRAWTKPYVIHGLSNFNVPIFSRSRREKLVVTVHDLIPLFARSGVSAAYYWQLKAMLPRVLRVVDQVVCVSTWTRRTVEDVFPFAASKCVVIKNGMPISRWPMAAKLPRKQDEIVALFVARFEGYKRHDRQIAWLENAPTSWRLVVATDSHGARFYREEAADLLTTGRITLHELPSPEALSKLYEAADVYVNTSQYEGFCLPAADALAAGKPVVYLPGSGIDEVAGKTVGFPVTHGDNPVAWVEAIAAATQSSANPDFAERLAAHLASLGTWKDAATELKTLYNGLK